MTKVASSRFFLSAGFFLLHELERSSNQAYLCEFDAGKVQLVIMCYMNI